MLKPAICYKAEIEDALKEYFYTDDMMFYQGCVNSYLIEVRDEGMDGLYQYAVVGKDHKLIGYIDYKIDYYSSCAYNFGAFSFKRGNAIMGKELFDLLETMIKRYHRVEFRAVSGNPAVKGYDKFLECHKDIGKKHIFKDAFRDIKGDFHDTYLYEFVSQIEEVGK